MYIYIPITAAVVGMVMSVRLARHPRRVKSDTVDFGNVGRITAAAFLVASSMRRRHSCLRLVGDGNDVHCFETAKRT